MPHRQVGQVQNRFQPAQHFRASAAARATLAQGGPATQAPVVPPTMVRAVQRTGVQVVPATRAPADRSTAGPAVLPTQAPAVRARTAPAGQRTKGRVAQRTTVRGALATPALVVPVTRGRAARGGVVRLSASSSLVRPPPPPSRTRPPARAGRRWLGDLLAQRVEPHAPRPARRWSRSCGPRAGQSRPASTTARARPSGSVNHASWLPGDSMFRNRPSRSDSRGCHGRPCGMAVSSRQLT